MTKHESLSPSPKAIGPKVPAEKLIDGDKHFRRNEHNECTYDNILKLQDNHMKKILLYWVSTLSRIGTGVIPCESKMNTGCAVE